MNRELLEKLEAQLQPKSFVGLMVAAVALTGLTAYLYLLKAPLDRYFELVGVSSPLAIEEVEARSVENERQIAQLETRVEQLRNRLYGTSAELPLEKMESHVIDRLDRLSVARDVQLVSVTPSEPGRVLMFGELPYDVDITGDYFSLYDWLHDAEEALRPMIVKRFEMSRDARSKRVAMKLRLVSYRPSEKST